jgi:hypothetical protein
VGKAWTTGSTGYADNNANIAARALQAFNYFESRGVKKYFTRARPSIFTNGQPAIVCAINVDFSITDSTAPLSFSPQVAGLWDVGLWDQAIWGSDVEITNNWQGITGIGYCGAIQLNSTSKNMQIQWAATDVVYQMGWAGI